MRERLRKVLLWLWPKIRAVYDRCELRVDLLDRRIFPAGVAGPSEQSAAAEPAALPAISGAHAHGESRGTRVPGAHVLLVALVCAVSAQAAPSPDALNAVHNAFRGFANPFRMGEPLANYDPQGGGSQSGPAFRFDGSYNLLVNCITGCSASSGFTDNGMFTVGTSTINPIGAFYSTSTPSISSGNAGRVRMDANSYLYVDCVTGCSASAGFADNTSFTAGTTAIGITGGWYSTSPTNCTTGNACAPQLTIDRKLFVQDFQGTSPWVVSANGGSFAVTQSGTWTLQPGNTANTTAWLVTGTGGTFPATESGTWNVGLSGGSNTVGKVDILGNAGGTLDSSGQNQAGTNWLTAGCNFFTSPTTISNTQGSPLGCDNADNLLVHVNIALPAGSNVIGGVTGSGNFTVVQGTGSNLHMVCDSGCSSSAGFADNSAFTVGTTAINPIGGLYDTGADPSISNGNAGRARIDSHSYLLVDGSQVTQPVSGTFWQATQPVSGTFWQSTQPVSLASFPALVAGTAIIGKVGIDQTTPGTTNAVQETNFPSTVDTNTGNASASTIREAVATNNPAIASWGQGATGSAVPSGAVYGAGNGSGNLKGYINCDNTYVNNGLATSGSTQAVALTSGKSIYICDFFVNTASTTAVNVKLVYGTGTNCATSPSDLSILVPMQAPTSIAPAGQNVTSPGNTLWSTPASQAVCVNLSSANAVNVMFHWTQF